MQYAYSYTYSNDCYVMRRIVVLWIYFNLLVFTLTQFLQFFSKNAHIYGLARIRNKYFNNDNIFSECVYSYGEDCQIPCSVHCINRTCDRFNGSCYYSCM